MGNVSGIITELGRSTEKEHRRHLRVQALLDWEDPPITDHIKQKAGESWSAHLLLVFLVLTAKY